MKKTVKIEGLDCPNCAKALEKEINKLDEVQNANLDFFKSTLTFESEDETRAIDNIIQLVKQIEPNVKIISKSKNKNNKMLFLDCLFLLLGIGIGLIIFFVSMPKWTFWTLYSISALFLGWKTYYKAITQLFHGIVNENLLVTISVVGASVVSEHMEGLMVIALYSIGKIFEGLAVDKSRKSIEKLARMQPEYAILLDKNGNEMKVEPQSVKTGSFLVVKAGEKVPIDSIITNGACMVDMQSLTGESVPVSLKEGDEILSGSIVLDSVITIQTTNLYADSTISKIMNLVENANENKSKTETLISKITKWYTLGVVAFAIMVWGIVWGVTGDFSEAIYRGLIFLVISCPCAFAISVPLAYFSGLGNASKNGILIKGSNYLDACARIKTVAFDKTGTLTTGQFTIDKIVSMSNQYDEKEILHLCALGEQNSLHPLAKSIVSAYSQSLEKVKDVKEIAGHGVEFSHKNKQYFVGKLDTNLSNTTVEIYENKIKIGEIILSDTIKSNSKVACQSLKEMKIKTALLSGDSKELVLNVSKILDIDEAHGQMLPQEKYSWLQSNKNKNNTIGYVGDGINDAPSLALSDVGFSMGINGSPASIEASDIVIVDDNPAKIATSIKISKHTRKIVLENIGLSALIKIVFLSLGAAGITGMLAAVFADVGVTLLAIFNSLRALYFKPNKNKKSS